MYGDILKILESKMQKSIDAYVEELKTIRAGRANPALLDGLSIDYYGTQTPLNQVATITAAEARLITIQPWDASTLQAIEKTILQSKLGITPSNDGKIIRLPFPALTEERRKEIAKLVRSQSENAKVALRNSRREAMDGLKKAEKNSEISEDELRAGEQKVQDMIDKFTKEIETITEEKEKEIMEI